MISESELDTYSPVGATIVRSQPRKKSTKQITWWQLFENAAKSQFGLDIEVLRTKACEEELTRFVEDLLFTVIKSDSEPVVTRPTIIDVTTKELVNFGEREKDESVIRVGKNLPICAGTRYHFSSSEGVTFDPKYNFAARVVGLAMAGGFMRVGPDKSVRDQEYNPHLQFSYNQEEKLIVPQRTKVKVKIITFTKKFRQNYTLEFNTPRTRYVNVSYLTRCQQNCRDKYCCFCCGCPCCQPKQGVVYANDILRTLPSFVDGGGLCSFTQDGTLTWVGESCNIEKTEVVLQ